MNNFKRIISAIFCLTMLLTVFSCIGKKQSVSFDTNAEPNSLTDEQKQYIIDCLNKKKQKKYGDHYFPVTLEKFNNTYLHYGTYNGYAVLFSKGTQMAATERRYGEYVFRYASGFGITVFKDGVFQSFEYAINNDWISETDLNAIFTYHNGTLLPMFQVHDIDCPENAAPGELPEETVIQFAAAFEKLGYNASLIRHYGTYEGVTFFFKDGEEKANMPFFPVVHFDHNCEVLYTDKEYSEMIVFKDGFFDDGNYYFPSETTLQYRMKYELSNETVDSIVKYHESRLPDELKRVIVEYPENAEPGTLPEETLKSLLSSYRSRHDAEANTIIHYGTANGIIMLYIYNSDNTNKLEFNKGLVLYNNGHFTVLSSDYRAQMSLVRDFIEKAEAYHKSLHSIN